MTLRLAATAVGHWEMFDGYAVAHNMPPLTELPIERFCSFVYWMMTREGTEQEVARLRAQLWQPPPEAEAEEVLDPRSPWSPENEGNALGALKAQLGLKSPPGL